MKAPNLPSLSDRRPLPQVGHSRGSTPSARGGNTCGASNSSSAFEHLADAQVLDLVDRADEVAPEVAQHLAPGDLVVGDAVERLFQSGREVVFDVAGEEAFQERDDQAALVLRDEPLLVDADIAAVLQHLQDRRVGGRPADAELLHALDQRGLGIARRRLGEVLGCRDRPRATAARRGSSRAGGGNPRPRRPRRGPPGRASGSRRTSRPGRWRAVRARARPTCAVMSTVVRSSSANSIWLATARFQISS